MRCGLFVILLAVAPMARGEDLSFLPRREYSARDSLDVGNEHRGDARQCLNGLKWEAAEFQVRCEESQTGRGAALVRFVSPVSSAKTSSSGSGGFEENRLVRRSRVPAKAMLISKLRRLATNTRSISGSIEEALAKWRLPRAIS